MATVLQYYNKFAELIDISSYSPTIQAQIQASWTIMAEVMALSDGVNGLSAYQTHDGYVMFYAGEGVATAGDNDLYWDRVNNRLGIHTTTPNEFLTVKGGALSLGTMTAPSATSGFGKIYVKSDGRLYYKTPSGTEYDLLLGTTTITTTGSAADNRIVRYDGAAGNYIQGSLITIDDYGNLVTTGSVSSSSISVSGSITVAGTVDGRDVSADGSTLDAHLANISNPHSVTPDQVGHDESQWNADRLQDRYVDYAIPHDKEVLAWEDEREVWTPSQLDISMVGDVNGIMDAYTLVVDNDLAHKFIFQAADGYTKRTDNDLAHKFVFQAADSYQGQITNNLATDTRRFEQHSEAIHYLTEAADAYFTNDGNHDLYANDISADVITSNTIDTYRIYGDYFIGNGSLLENVGNSGSASQSIECLNYAPISYLYRAVEHVGHDDYFELTTCNLYSGYNTPYSILGVVSHERDIWAYKVSTVIRSGIIDGYGTISGLSGITSSPYPIYATLQGQLTSILDSNTIQVGTLIHYHEDDFIPALTYWKIYISPVATPFRDNADSEHIQIGIACDGYQEQINELRDNMYGDIIVVETESGNNFELLFDMYGNIVTRS